jgi:hypothetical protein
MSKSLKFYVIIPKLLGLITNVNKIPEFTLAEELLDVFNEDKQVKIKVNYLVTNNSCDVQNRRELWSSFHVHDDEKRICYERRIFNGLKIYFSLVNMDSPPFITNTITHKLLRFYSGWLHPIGKHLVNICFVKLLSSGYLLLHGSCVASPDGEGMLIVAPPNTGKLLLLCL